MFGNKAAAAKRENLDFITNIRERNKYTPDIAKLQEHCFQLVFVYDRLQQGFFEHDKMLLEHSVRAAAAFTQERMVLLKKSLGIHSFPIALRKDWQRESHRPRRIQGELYYVLSEQLRELDSFYKNGVEYNRELVEVFIPFTKLKKIEPSKIAGVTKAEYKQVFGTEHPSEHVRSSTVCKAYAYIAADDYWDDLTDMNFSPATRYRAHNPEVGEYFSFKKRIDLTDD